MQIQIADFYNLKYLFVYCDTGLSISHASFTYALFKKHRKHSSAKKKQLFKTLSKLANDFF